MNNSESRNGTSKPKWETQLTANLKREYEQPERLYGRLKSARPANNNLNENHMKHKQAAQELDVPKKTSAAEIIQRKTAKSQNNSPMSEDSYSNKPQPTPFQFTRTNSKSFPTSPLRIEAKTVDEFKNIEEVLNVYTAADGKMSVFWTIPSNHMMKVQKKKVKFRSIAFPAKSYNNKKWSLQLKIIKLFEKSVYSDRIEVYLKVIKNEDEMANEDWHRDPTVTLSITQKKGDLTYERHFTERFDSDHPKWGLGIKKQKIDMMLKTPVTICCAIKPERVLRPADSEYVGLVNAGNTCYMNSFLQTLYHLPCLTKLVFQVPFTSETTVSIPTALQKLFYELKTSYTAVRTTELTKSFGWDTRQTWIQQDVQEFCCLLLDALDAKTKGIKGVENEINKLFEGKLISYVKCIKVNFESRREETFKEIQLQVKGLSNIYESLDSYVQDEILEGDNVYDTVKYGKQPARKGVRFYVLPPVLMIQLKRFEYDHELEKNIKICDAYEYFPEIDLSKYLETPPVIPAKYQLYSVLVHSGTGSASGHYYAFLRPEKDGDWYKFNDEYVDVAQLEEVYDANFGGTYTEAKLNRISKEIEAKKVMSTVTAYMLVYINENLIDQILKPLSDYDIPQSFAHEFSKQKKEEEDKHSQKVSSDNMIKIYLTSFDLLEDINTPGLTHYRLSAHDQDNYEKFTKDKSKRYKLRMPKSSKIPDLLEKISELSGIPQNEYHLFKISARDEKLIQITRGERIKDSYSLSTLINGTTTAIQGNLKNIVLILPINRQKHPKIFERDHGSNTEKGNVLRFHNYSSYF